MTSYLQIDNLTKSFGDLVLLKIYLLALPKDNVLA